MTDAPATDLTLRGRADRSDLASGPLQGDDPSGRWGGARLVSPPWLLIPALALSVLAWTIPWSASIHRGYAERVVLSSLPMLLIAGWYAAIIVTGAAGFALGRRLVPFPALDRLSADTYYRYFTVIGAVGVTYTYGVVVARHPSLLVNAIQHQTFNDVRLAFGYGAGVQTLRYTTILGGGIALHHIFFRSRFTRIDAANIVLLCLAAAAASRLSLVMATLIAVGSALREGRPAREIVMRTLGLVAAGLVLLTSFNYLRNANFYRENYHTANPLTMNLDETVAYLGAPFQASVVASRLASGRQTGDLGTQLVPNPSAQHGVQDWTAYDGGSPPIPTLVRAKRPGAVTPGSWALGVRMTNPTDTPRAKYIWVADRAAVEVEAGDRLMLRATVSGAASPRRPIRLGFRLANGIVSQAGFVPGSGGITLTHSADAHVLVGEFVAPPGTQTVQPAIWKEGIAPHGRATMTVDDVRLVRRSIVKAKRPSLAHALAAYLLPTYLTPAYADVAAAENNYRRYTTIEATLTTNSAFAAMAGSLGTPWAFVVISTVSFIAAALAGHASLYRTPIWLATLIISYVFAELWRVYLFNYGIIQFLVLVLVVIPLAHPHIRTAGLRLRPMVRR